MDYLPKASATAKAEEKAIEEVSAAVIVEELVDLEVGWLAHI